MYEVGVKGGGYFCEGCEGEVVCTAKPARDLGGRAVEGTGKVALCELALLEDSGETVGDCHTPLHLPGNVRGDIADGVGEKCFTRNHSEK